MTTQSALFLEVLEWFDSTGQEIAHRIPEGGSGEIKYGAQLTVRESQAAVFFYQGKAYDAFGPGRHTLQTANIPIVTRLLSLPWGMTSPLRAEVVFVNLKLFPDLKWGTRDPVAFKDSELGLVRLRAHGMYNLSVVQPVLFINSLVGTRGSYSVTELEDYLGQVIVSRLNDHLGRTLQSILQLPGQYQAIAQSLTEALTADFQRFGLRLNGLVIDAITPPAEVQQAIDDRSRLGVLPDLEKLARMKAAMAVEKAAESKSEAGSGLGLGLGLLLPSMLAQGAGGTGPAGGAAGPTTVEATCSACHRAIPADARYCPACGHQQVTFDRCRGCGRDLLPGARFCPACGRAVEQPESSKRCPHCGAEDLPDAVYCNRCGEKLDGHDLAH